MPDFRRVPVPDGLVGMRVDAGLARLLGLSRTTVSTMIDAGDVAIDGAIVARSARLPEGSWLEFTLPEPPRISPRDTAHQVDRSREAILMIAMVTPSATSARIQVIPVAIEKAAPGLRINEK